MDFIGTDDVVLVNDDALVKVVVVDDKPTFADICSWQATKKPSILERFDEFIKMEAEKKKRTVKKPVEITPITEGDDTLILDFGDAALMNSISINF